MTNKLTPGRIVCALLIFLAYTSEAQIQAPERVQQTVAPIVEYRDSELPPNINPFDSRQRRDKLDAAFVRLGRAAMSADLNEFEPWLFDRASTFYKLALTSGEEDFKNYAFALVDRYYSQIGPTGEFALKPGDAKYSYTDGAVWYEHATGDARYRPQAEAVYQLWLNEFPNRYSESLQIWTEREIAYALGAALGWYELSGNPDALQRATALIQQWAEMSTATGAPLHTLAQHQEEFEPPWSVQRMTSPWMAALFLEYLQHYERLTGDELALRIVSDYADFLLENCLYDGSVNHPNLRGYLMPYYLCGEGGTFYERETPSEGDGEHTPDVMGIMAFSVYARRKLNLDSERALEAYEELRKSAAYFVGRRTDVSPPRKFSWWFGTSYDSRYLVE